MKKIFFDENGKEYEYNLLRYDKRTGTKAEVYRISSDRCIKLFRIHPYIEMPVFKKIIEMGLENYYQVYRLLYGMNGELKGYEMKFYPQEDIDILTMPVDYTLESLEAINRSSLRLSKNGIFVNDLHDENVILTKNGIIVIDADDYSEARLYEGQELEKYNTREVLYLFKMLYDAALESHHEKKEGSSECIERLFVQGQSPATVHKTLRRYKYPIEYINKHIK